MILCSSFSIIEIDNLLETIQSSVSTISGDNPIAYQNLQVRHDMSDIAQARLRMILSYYISQKSTNALVLVSSNLDEAIMGYFTKYDCSSGDLNPIGSIHKSQIRSMVAYFLETFGSEKFGILEE